MKDDNLTQLIIGCAYKVITRWVPDFSKKYMRTLFELSLKSWD